MQPQFTTTPLPLEFEEWRPIVGYEGWYEVSNLGRVRRIKAYNCTLPGLILRACRGTTGYLQVSLYRNNIGKSQSVHRLVAETFLRPCPPDYEVNHINGIKADNREANLEWVTSRQNMRHATRCGLNEARPPHYRGERNPKAKLTAADVRTIRALAGTVRGTDLAKRYGLSSGAIYHIVKGRHWAHVT